MWGAGALTFLSDGRSRGRCPTGPACALRYTAEPSQGLDRPGTGLSFVSPLGTQRKMISEGYRTAWSIWLALGDQEQLGSTLRAEIDLFMCIKQTGVNYTTYTSSIFFLSLSGLAVIIPDLVAAHRSPCGDKLHGRIRLILIFSKSMKWGLAIRDRISGDGNQCEFCLPASGMLS